MPEQTQLTELGKEIIPVKLVGQNAGYQVLKEPARPAYPRGDEVRYSDDYLSRLNATYSLGEVLGEHIETIAQRKGLETFVMGSPLRNSEGEYILGHMLISSAQAGLWQPFVIDVPRLTDTSISTARDYLEDVEKISPDYNVVKLEGGVLFGLSVAKRGGLALPIEHENKVIVVPSQEFLEYAAKQR